MKRKALNEVNLDLYNLFKNVRDIFYSLLNKIANKDSINNNNSRDNIFNMLSKLEGMVQYMNETLKIFNENPDKIEYIQDEYISNLINTNQININRNYDLVDIDIIIKNLAVKLNILDYLNKKIFSLNKGNLIQYKANNNKNSTTQQIDGEKIYNYIKQNKFKIVSFKLVNNDNQVNNNPTLKYIEFGLNNFTIKLIPQRQNNLCTKNFEIKSEYISLYNTLLMRKIRNELSKMIELLYNKYINKDNSGIAFLKSVIIYIHDFDKIFYIKCYSCKRNSKYSFSEKTFFPPFIKYNFEKYNNLKFQIKDKDILFFHPQCID